MASNTIKGLTIEIGGDTTKLGKAVKDLETQAKKASNELKDINAALKVVPNSEELLLQKQKALAKEIEATSGKLDVLKQAEQQVQKQFEEGKASEEQVKALQREIILTTNSLEGYQKAAEETAQALKEASRASSDAANNTEKIGSASENAGKQEKTLTDTLKGQKEELTKLKEQYVNTATQYGKNSDEARDLEAQIKKLSSEVVKNEKAVKEASDTADKADDSMKDMGDSAEKAGGGLSTAAIAAGEFIGNLALDVLREAVSALKDIGQSILETGMGFESSMSKVKAIAGEVADDDLPAITKAADEMNLSYERGANATETAMNILEAKAREMGATTQFSAQEAADAMNYMAMAGWKADDMLAGISGVMNLAAASGEDLATTSDIVTDAMTALGMTTDQAGDFADVLAAASANANTNVSMLGESFKYVAPLAGAMDASVEDLSLALGLMANSGIKGSMAGNALKNALSKLNDPTKEQTEAMQKLGLVSTETIKVIDDGKISKAMTQVENKTLDVQKAQIAYNDAIKKYGEDSSQAQTKLINLTKAENNLKAAEEALAKAQEGTVKTIAGQSVFVDEAGNMKSLSDIMDALRESLGSVNVELTNADGSVKEYEQLIGELEQSEEGLTQVEQIKNAAILFGERSLSGMLAIINASEEDYEKLKTAIYESGGAAEDMATTMNDNLAGSVKLLSSAWQDFEITVYKSANAPLRDLVDLVTTDVIPALTSLINGEEGADKALGEALGGVIDTALKQLNDALPTISTVAGSLIMTLVTSLADSAPEIITTLFNVADEAADGLGESLPVLVDKMYENLVRVADILADRTPQLVEKLGSSLVNSIPLIADSGFRMLMGLLQAFPRLITNLAPVVSQLVVSLVEMLVSHAPEYQEGVYNLLLAFLDAIPPLIEALVPLIPDIVMALIDALLDNSDELEAGAEKMFWVMIEAQLKMGEKLIEAVASLLVTCLNTARKYIPKLTELTDYIVDLILSPIRDLKQKMIDSGHNVIAGLLQGIEEKATSLYKAVTNLANNIIDKITKPFEINSPSKKMKWVGEMIDEGLAEGIEESSDEPQEQMDDMSQKLIDDAKNQDLEFPVKARLVEEEQQKPDMLQRLQEVVTRLMYEPAPLPAQIESQQSSGGVSSGGGYYTDPALYKRLDALLDAVRAGRVIAIDGDKLVGATVGAIDQQLGALQYNAERGDF